jgi:type VI protein secretion system component Hcp
MSASPRSSLAATAFAALAVLALAAPAAWAKAESGGPPASSAPRDVSSGLATGKRRHQPLVVHKTVDSASPTIASHPTGKRQHQPLTVTKTTDAASPSLTAH